MTTPAHAESNLHTWFQLAEQLDNTELNKLVQAIPEESRSWDCVRCQNIAVMVKLICPEYEKVDRAFETIAHLSMELREIRKIKNQQPNQRLSLGDPITLKQHIGATRREYECIREAASQFARAQQDINAIALAHPTVAEKLQQKFKYLVGLT